MENVPIEKLQKELKDALFLHKKLKNKELFIRIINPTHISFLNELKDLEKENVRVEIDFRQKQFDIVWKDIQNIGVVLIDRKLFEIHKAKLYDIKIPIIVFGKENFENIKTASILLTKNKDIEHISSVVFDVSIQLKLNLILYDIDPDRELKKDIIEHYQNLANIFGKNIEVVKSKNNPIREMRKKEGILQFLPFNKKILKKGFLRYLKTDPETLYFRLNSFPQLFVPTT
jgi:hypothetical protein